MAKEQERQTAQVVRFILGSPAFRSVLDSLQHAPPFRGALPEAGDIADELMDDAEFQALRLGTWLNSPDGRLIAEAVSHVIPPADRPEYDLVIEALQLAAELQQEAGQKVAGAVALGTFAIAGLFILLPSLRRTFPASPSLA